MTERTRALLLRLVLLAQAVQTVIGILVTARFVGDRAVHPFPAWYYLPTALFLVAALALAFRPRRLPVAIFEALHVPGLALAISRGFWPISGLVLVTAAAIVLLLPGAPEPATGP